MDHRLRSCDLSYDNENLRIKRAGISSDSPEYVPFDWIRLLRRILTQQREAKSNWLAGDARTKLEKRPTEMPSIERHWYT